MTCTNNTLIGWEVFYIGGLDDVGETKHECMLHGTRAEARDHMRQMKAQPWNSKTVFMFRVSFDSAKGRMVWEKAR